MMSSLDKHNSSITMFASAKVNLGLDVSTEIIEGKHRLQTIMLTLDLCDELEFISTKLKNPINPHEKAADNLLKINMIAGDGYPFSSKFFSQIDTHDNLVYKAIRAFQKAINEPIDYQINVNITKNIPLKAGLGGGSSDAASAIAYMCKLYGINTTDALPLKVASEIGSDIAFFLQGGCALMGGCGEILKKALPFPKMDIVLAMPDDGLSTLDVYKTFDSITNGEVQNFDEEAVKISQQMVTENFNKLLSAIENGESVKYISRLIGNSLQTSATLLSTPTAQLVQSLNEDTNVLRAIVSGSGSSVFGICEGKEAAVLASQAIKKYASWTKVCSSVAFGAGLHIK